MNELAQRIKAANEGLKAIRDLFEHHPKQFVREHLLSRPGRYQLMKECPTIYDAEFRSVEEVTRATRPTIEDEYEEHA